MLIALFPLTKRPSTFKMELLNDSGNMKGLGIRTFQVTQSGYLVGGKNFGGWILGVGIT